jgi:hypothetical protein
MCPMALSSDPRFLVHHALRIKGFAKVEHLSDLSGLPAEPVTAHLEAMQADGHSMFREARGLWQLTPPGRDAHPELLEADAGRPGFRDGLAKSYPDFLKLNEDFKALCGDWQLKDGGVNDHSDAKYDAGVLKNLTKLDNTAQSILSNFGSVADRFAGFGPRLTVSKAALDGGQANMFTGVMCASYHDVWMELHEDLILTQGIDRKEEGSF